MRTTRETGKELAAEISLFAVGTGAIALCHGRPLLLTALLIGTATAAIVAFWPGSHVVVLYAIGAVVGPCGEMIGVRAGAWRYACPTFLGIPLWLPFAWGLATVLVRGIAETVAKVARE